MPIPASTTFITVLRRPTDATSDPWEPAAQQEVVSGVRAVIDSPRGREITENSAQEVLRWKLNCDPTDLRHTDVVRDERTLDEYEVEWVSVLGTGMDLEHIEAGLKKVTGLR